MTSKLSKEAFIKLAAAFSNQENYEKELSNNIETINEKYKVYMGFVGFPSASGLIMDVVLDLLGEDFSYYFYDCNESFEKFNCYTTLADGTHPKVKDLEDLWEFSQGYRDDTK